MTRTSEHAIASSSSAPASAGSLLRSRWAAHPVEVTLVNRANHHLFQPLLYQVATGILSEGEIAPATRDVLKKNENVSVELGEVTGFDLQARHIIVVQPGGREVTLPTTA